MSLIHHIVVALTLNHGGRPDAVVQADRGPRRPPSGTRPIGARASLPARIIGTARRNRPVAPTTSQPTRTTCANTATDTATTAPSGPATAHTPRQGRRWRWLALTAQLVVLALLAAGSTAHADPTITPVVQGGAPIDTVVLAIAGSVDEVLTNVRNWLMGILASLATVYLTIGGVRRVFASGDPGEQEKAKEAFKAAAIGYCLAALAPLVVTVLKGLVGA